MIKKYLCAPILIFSCCGSAVEYKEPVIFKAIYQDNPSSINFLEQYTDIDSKDINGDTPLILACELNKLRCIKKLLSLGADINASNNIGITPLMISVIYKNLGLVEQILEFGVNIEAKSISGDTALMLAVRSGDLDLVNLLLDYGANIWTINNQKKSVLDLASSEILPEIEKIFRDNLNELILNKLILCKDLESANNLLKVYLNSKPFENSSVKKAVIEKILVQFTQNFNLRDLILVASLNKYIYILILINQTYSYKTNIFSEAQKFIETHKQPLCMAIYLSYLTFAKELINKNMYINDIDEQGDIPIFIATKFDLKQLIGLLIDKSNLIHDNNKGESILNIIARNEKSESNKIITDKLDAIFHEQIEPALPKSTSIKKWELKLTELINQDTSIGRFIKSRLYMKCIIIFIAAYCTNNNPEDLTILAIKLNSNTIVNMIKQCNFYSDRNWLHINDFIHSLDNPNIAAIYYALAKEYYETAKFLINAGYDVNKYCFSTGLTPIIMAAYNGKLDIVRLLVEKKADINISPERYVNLIAVAVASDNINLVKYILSLKSLNKNFINADIISIIITKTKNLSMFKLISPLDKPINGIISLPDYNTPLMDSIKHEAWDICKYLISIENNLNFKNKLDKTALNMLLESKKKHENNKELSVKIDSLIQELKSKVIVDAKKTVKNRR